MNTLNNKKDTIGGVIIFLIIFFTAIVILQTPNNPVRDIAVAFVVVLIIGIIYLVYIHSH
jgi:hypothetical protein